LCIVISFSENVILISALSATVMPYILISSVLPPLLSGFGGLVVSVLASGTQDHWFEPSRSRRIFRAKKSSARLHSEGK